MTLILPGFVPWKQEEHARGILHAHPGRGHARVKPLRFSLLIALSPFCLTASLAGAGV